MKRSVIFSIFIIASVYFVFAETPAITVRQSIRYADGSYVELLTPQISKAKALKTDKGKVLLRYDFSVEKSSSRNNIGVAIYVPLDVPIYPAAIDNAKSVEEVAEELGFSISDWEIVRKSPITYVYRTDRREPQDYIAFYIVGKKGTKATVEFQLDVSNWTNEELPIDVRFFSSYRERGLGGFLRDVLILPVIKDWFSGEFNGEAYEASNRKFTLLITK